MTAGSDGTVATFTTTTIAGGPTTTLAPGTPTSRPPIRPQVPAGETGGYAVTAVGDSVLLGASGTLARTRESLPATYTVRLPPIESP